jgi:putative transposase
MSLRQAKSEKMSLQPKSVALLWRLTGSKKNLKKCSDMKLRRGLIEKDDDISISRKCELLGVNRASFYYKPKPMSKNEIARRELIMQKIDFIHTKSPYMGAKKIAKKIKREHGIDVGKKLTRKLMEQMGIYCVYPKPNTSRASKHHKKISISAAQHGYFLAKPSVVY